MISIPAILFVFVIDYCWGGVYRAEDCQTYKDTLVVGLHYPGHLATEVHSCADKYRLKDLLKRVFDIKFNKTIVNTANGGPKYRDKILLLSPRSTLPFHRDELPSHAFKNGLTTNSTMHIIKATQIRNTIWKREGNFHTFSEIILEDEEEIKCPDDVFDTTIRVFDGKDIYNKAFTTEDPKDMKVIIIPILKNVPMCLKLGLVNDRKVDDRSTLTAAYKDYFKSPAGVIHNPYLTSSALYQTTLESLYPNFDRIKNMGTSTAPWLDEGLKALNSTWCRGHRHIVAFAGFVFEFSDDDGDKVEMEATEACYCSVQVLGDRRLIYVPFPSFGFSIVIPIKKTKEEEWFVEPVHIRRTSDKKEFGVKIKINPNKLTQSQTRYHRANEFEQWNKESDVSCSRPHLRYRWFGVEFRDYGVGYNFSKTAVEMNKILGTTYEIPTLK